jgi:hypothetical protein
LQFRQSKVQNLYAGLGHHDVPGLEITVSDPSHVGCGHRVGDLLSVLNGLREAKLAFLKVGGQSFALHQLHYEMVGPTSYSAQMWGCATYCRYRIIEHGRAHQ